MEKRGSYSSWGHRVGHNRVTNNFPRKREFHLSMGKGEKILRERVGMLGRMEH